MTNSKKKLSADNAVTIENLSYSDLMRFEANDFGNAKRFLKFVDGKALYDSASSKWFIFESGRWKPDNERKERVHKLADGFYSFLVNGLREEYQCLESYGVDPLEGTSRDIDYTDVNEDQQSEIHALLKQCKRDRQIILKLGNHSCQNRVIRSAEAQSVDDRIELNPSNHLLVVANGTVDLKTGKLSDHSQSHLSTMCAPVSYNPKAKTPKRFLKFLKEIFDGNESLINYVHRLLGYCLTGETSEQEFYILYGSGGNGKNVLIDLIKRILGEYCSEISSGALAHRIDGDKPNPTLLQAKDCRIIIANESEKGARLNTSLIKQISAGNEICPRALFKDNEHFLPHMKILWATNNIPEIDWGDRAMERRFKLITFPVFVAGENRDKQLPDILWKEREEILKWLIQGAVSYYKNGMAEVPEIMLEAMDRERVNADSVLHFFKKMVVPTGDLSNQYKAHPVYDMYKKTCTEKWHVEPVSEKTFGLKFLNVCKGTPIIKKRQGSGYRYYGLKLLPVDADSKVTAETA